MTKLKQWFVVPCTVLLFLPACLSEEAGDPFASERYATTGGSTNTASTYGNLDGIFDDNVDDNFDDVGSPLDVPWDTPTTFDVREFCQTPDGNVADLEKAPFKTPTGLWDQHGWGACGYISLINANIVAGADDEGGLFEGSIRGCLEDEGMGESDLADGTTKSEMRKIARCKEKIMKLWGSPVDIDEVRLDGPFSTDLKKRCAKMKAALDAGGSATASFRNDGFGHTMQVMEVECNDSDVTLTLLEPNDPNGPQVEVVIDGEDHVEVVSGDHIWLEPGAEMFRAMIETPKD